MVILYIYAIKPYISTFIGDHVRWSSAGFDHEQLVKCLSG